MFAREIHKGAEILDRLKIDVSTPSAVAAVRPALGDVLFSAEAQTPIATIASLDVDFCLIDKHISCLVTRLLHLDNKKRMVYNHPFVANHFYCYLDYVYLSATETHLSVCHCEQCIVPAHSHV